MTGSIPRREWLWLGLILLLAASLRLYRLNDVPPGLTHDEAGNGKLALGALQGERPIYFSVSNGREPLYVYSMAPLFALLGPSQTSLRLTSALWGLALILAVWAWARRAFNPAVATLAAGFLTVSFWPLMVSRLGLRAVTLPALFAGSAYFFWRAQEVNSLEKPKTWRHFGLAGLLLGASFYTYMASRALPLVPILFWLYLALFHRGRARSTWRGMLLLLLVTGLVTAPLLGYLQTHPQAESRVEQLADPLRQAQAGNWEPLQQNLVAGLKIFSVDGDPHWIYNISGRPLLDPLSGLLFYTGLLLALWRWRRPAYLFCLLWLGVGLAPVYVTGADSSVLRAVAAQPAVYLLQALALYEASRWLSRRRVQLVAYLLPGLALLVVVLISLPAYFQRWPNQRDVRVAYHTHLLEIARYLDQQSEGGTVLISSMYPGLFHDPYAFEFLSQRDDLRDRWCDGRFGLLLPDVAEAYAVFPALAPLDAALQPYFDPHAQQLDRVLLRADDLNPWFEVYGWSPRQARDSLPSGQTTDLGHTLALVDHRLGAASVPPGGTVELLTFWHVLKPPPDPLGSELVLFTHLLDGAGQVVGQQDRLDVPAWNWEPGDRFIQLHRFPIDPALPPGRYPLEVGAYYQTEGYPRLPVYQAGEVVGDRVLLEPIEVVAP